MPKLLNGTALSMMGSPPAEPGLLFFVRALLPSDISQNTPELMRSRARCIITAVWPQEDVPLAGRRVAVIGTGASGVQVIQEVGKVASHLTVFQRTPNTALPMTNPDVTAERNQKLKDEFSNSKRLIDTTFAGFDYEFNFDDPMSVPKDERMAFYEKLYNTGGLHFWLGTYKDVLFQEEPNEEAYQFWRSQNTAPYHF